MAQPPEGAVDRRQQIVDVGECLLGFETRKALRDFITQGWELGGQLSAAVMAADQGGMFAGAISVAPGVYLYQLTETGLPASITVTGTKFFKDPDLNGGALSEVDTRRRDESRSGT